MYFDIWGRHVQGFIRCVPADRETPTGAIGVVHVDIESSVGDLSMLITSEAARQIARELERAASLADRKALGEDVESEST